MFTTIISKLFHLTEWLGQFWPHFLEFYQRNTYSVRLAMIVFLWYVYSAIITIFSGFIISVVACCTFIQGYKYFIVLKDHPTIQQLPWHKAEPFISTIKSIPEKKDALVTRVMEAIRSKFSK